MPSLRDILEDPNYVNANAATKAAIFDKWSAKDENYTGANDATKAAIRERFGVGTAAVEQPKRPEQAPEDSSDFVRGVTNYVPQMKETFGGMKVLAGKVLGSKDIMQSGLDTLKEAKAKLAPRSKPTDSFSEAWKQGMGAVLTDWLPYQVGSGVANLGESLAVMTAGSMVGSAIEPGIGTIAGGATGLLEKQLVKQGIREAVDKVLKEEGEEAAKKYFEREASAVAKQLAKDIGGKAGLASQAGIHGVGETTSRAVEEAQRTGGTGAEIELSRVAPAAVVHGVAEYFGDKIGLGAWEGINPNVKTGLLNMAGNLVKNVAVTGTKEAPVEVIQSMAERFGAKLSLADAEAVKEYVDSAAAAYGMSVVPGAGGTMRDYAAAMQKDDQRRAEEALKQRTALEQEAAASTQTAEQEAAKVGTTAVPNAEGEVVTPSFSPLQVGAAKADELLGAGAPEADPLAALEAKTTPERPKLPPAKKPNETPEEEFFRYQEMVRLGVDHTGKTLAKGYLTSIKNKLINKFGYNPEAGNGKQLTGTNIAGNQPSTAGAASESGVAPGGAGAPNANRVVPAGGTAKPATTSEGAQRSALNEIPYDTVEFAGEGQPLRRSNGKSQVINFGGRMIVMRNVNGTMVPFYLSTGQGGKADVASGKWYPFFGIGTDGWINKTGGKEMTSYYGSEALRQAAEELDNTIGDIRNDNSVPKVSSTGQHIDFINQGLTPAENRQADTLTKVKENINRVVNAVEGKGEPSVTETTQAKQAETQGQEQAAAATAPAVNLEAARAAYEAGRKTALESGLSEDDIPSFDELSDEQRAALAKEMEAENATKGMLPSKRERPKSAYLTPAMAGIIKARIDKKIASGEIDLKAIPQPVIDAYNENYKNQEGRLPKWEALNDDQKAIYLSAIRKNTALEQDTAFNNLRNYRKSAEKITEKGSEEGAVPEGASIYELNRQAYSSALPKWADLDSEAQQKFLDAIKPGLENVNKEGKVERKVTQEQMDTGFADVYIHNAEKETKETTPAQERERRNEETRQARIEREAVPEVEAGERLPKPVILQLFKGDIKGVLAYLTRNAQGMEAKVEYTSGRRIDEKRKIFRNMQKSISRVLFRNLSRVLGTLTFNSKVVMDESNPIIKQLRREGKLAAYDPKTDTFYFTNDGLDEQTVLHEIVHAATIKILYAYKTNPSSLTQEQREAAEHIEKIYEFAKARLGGRHKFAFENVYEFVSYAMTDPKLQADLANIQARGLGKYSNQGMSFLRSITDRFGNLWGQFTQALMKMYGMVRAGRTFAAAENVQDEILKGFNEENQETLGYGPEKSTWGRKGVIIPRPKEERVTKEQIASSFTQAGYEANALVEMAEAFGRILSVPEAGIALEALPAKAPKATKPAKKPKPKQPLPAGGSTKFEEIAAAFPSVTTNVRQEVRKMGWSRVAEDLVRLVQNDRVALKNWQNRMRQTGRLIAYAAGFNNISDQITLSSGNAFHLYTQYLQNDSDAIRKDIIEYAKRNNLDIDEATNQIGLVAVALHENERREILYLYNVPLETVRQTLQDAQGNKFTADAARAAIIEQLTTQKLSDAKLKQLRKDLNAIVKDKNNWDKKAPAEAFDINSERYSAAGFSQDQIKAAKAEYNKRKDEFDPILKKMKDVNKAVLKLNGMSNYMSAYANNFIGFYGFDNYVPLKGKYASAHNSDKVDMFNFDSRKIGGELQEGQHAMEGRTSVPDNPVLQVLADGAQASLRAGRRHVTEAISNAIDDKTLSGEEVTVLSFQDRFNTDELDKLRGQNVIFHYMPDGKIRVLKINDTRVADAIRRTYREANPLTDWLVKKGNLLTGTIGQMHTRYNVAFAPVNFVRDVLTNAFTLGANLGPQATFQYIGAVAADVASGKMSKTMNFARLYNAGKIDVIEDLAKNDKSGYYADLLNYVETGGKVSYISGIATKGQYQELQKTVGANKALHLKKQIDDVFDTWIDTFELAARVSAYRVTKASEVARLTKEDPKRSKAEIEHAANVTAAAYAKNLANFEQVGEWGKALGAFFMFFRPSATGAVRAIDAIMPMFQSVERAKLGLPEYARVLNIKQELSGEVSKTQKAKLEAELATMEKAVETFEKNYGQQRKNAQVMTAALAGVGFTAYLMSQMLADDDDLGRNKTATDDMSRWTRSARFFIPGFKDPIQIPWGYGLGAFAAIGAQVAAMFNGNTRLGDTIGNLTTISMDSFLPLPVSRIPPTEQPLPFVIDSLVPSVARPLVEYVMNVDALGRQIYNNRQTRFGDAYTGGDNIPEAYKDAAIWWLETTGNDVSPNSLYFFANNYADGASRIIHNGNNMRLWLTGKKDFDAKTDLMVFDSFIGRQSNFDARQWQRVENDLKERSARVKMLKENNPVEYVDYLSKHPLDRTLADMYNHDVNGHLRDLRAKANQYRAMPGIDPKTRTELINNVVLQENLEKRRLLNIYEAYGVKP